MGEGGQVSLSDLNGFALVAVPLLIFAARVVDVSFGTLRIVFIARDLAIPAALVGFCESLIWLIAVTQIIQHLSSPFYFVAYALGFAAGNYVGILIERRLALGTAVVQLTTRRPSEELLRRFRAEGMGATVARGEGKAGPVDIIQAVVPRRRLRFVLDSISESHEGDFFTVVPVARVGHGAFPVGRRDRLAIAPLQRK
jgi:uncharacterized protein YebE (UPF0316 family)